MILIKNRLFFLIILESINSFCFLTATEFNPEQYEFSKKETIVSWIAPEFHDQKIVEQIQKWIAGEMPQNLEGLKNNNVICRVKNNDEDTQFFGRTFWILTAVQLKFLQNIRACCDQNKNPIILEIGAAGGTFSLKILLALGTQGTLIVNDKSSYEVEKAKIFFAKRINEIGHNIDNVIFDAGDAAYFLDRNPEFNKKIDYCY